MGNEEVKREPFSNPWKIHRKISNCFYVLYRLQRGRIRYAPLYIHSFRFITNRHLTKAQTFLFENPNPQILPNVSDKLKWYRYYNELLQSKVAKAMEIDRTTYSRYEENVIDVYPLDKLEFAAKLFQIEVTELLDDYNLFLYNGQGSYIKKLRKSLKLTQSEFAKMFYVPLGTLKKWEQERVRLQKRTFEKLLEFSNIL